MTEKELRSLKVGQLLKYSLSGFRDEDLRFAIVTEIFDSQIVPCSPENAGGVRITWVDVSGEGDWHLPYALVDSTAATTVVESFQLVSEGQ